jgi:hypothetical protein
VESVVILNPVSLPVPEIVVAHCATPLVLYFTMKASLVPTVLGSVCLITTDLGDVIPLMITALVVGDTNAPIWDALAIAPKLEGATIAPPPDLDTLATVPAGTYCAAALTSAVKSDPDGRRIGIFTI